jgi:adenylate cyclase
MVNNPKKCIKYLIEGVSSMKFFAFDRTKLVSLLLSVGLSLLIFLIYAFTNLFSGIENMSLDSRFYWRDPTQKKVEIAQGVTQQKENPLASQDIIILAIDEETIRQFDSVGIHWPFPWQVHAQVTNFVSTGSPNTILFDIMFLDHKDGEEELAEAFKKAGNVAIDYQFEKEKFQTQYPDINERMAILDEFMLTPDSSYNKDEIFEEVVPPTPLIGEGAKYLGFANVIPDEDNTTRKSPLVLKHDGKFYPSIVLVGVMNYYGITLSDVEIKMGKYIKLKNIPSEKLAKKTPNNEILIPINDFGQMDINYVGIHGSFQSMPYFYFYQDGDLGGPQFENKIILIAAYSLTGVADDVERSPFGEIFGIEHHANAINTILTQNFLRSLSTVQNLLLFIGIGFILGFFLPRIPILFSLILTVVLGVGYSFLNVYLFSKHNFILSLPSVVIMIVLNFSLMTIIRILTEQREKQYIRKTFSKFVSKSVVDELLKSPDKLKLGGDKKELTVLFSDIRGFTTISEQLTPEQLVEHLNEYLQAMTDIVIKYNGTLDKYVGDEIMAFWGAPIPQNNHTLLACKAALEMMEVLYKLNENWQSIGKPPLNIGIGVNSGDMVVGNMGSTSRMDYTLMGDNVNLGARLEGTNKVYTTHIIISEFAYELVKDQVVVRELDLIRVKGKHKPVTIYELMGMVE